jgi:hypothetical protein
MASENAHAAKIENGIVTQVIVIPRQDNDDDELITAYCNGIGLSGTWIDTSYLSKRRGRYAGIGMKYDVELDKFIALEVVEAPAVDAAPAS